MDGTWEDAVRHYNRRYDPDVDIIGDRIDETSQIQIMGNWIKHVWDKAAGIVNDERLGNYGYEEISYGLWHQGQNSKAARIAHYLSAEYKTVHNSFKETYTESLFILGGLTSPAPGI